ncbi:MAG TPA: lipid II flippase MurJ, partial [Anaerolineaceae bacterium]|nr:lipid II flippase MurJ [Anaerolineaceae bacterium]
AIAQSIAIAALPTFSAQVARGRPDQMRTSLALTLRGVLLLTIPATLGLILLRFPLVTMLYQRGLFDSHSTELVAWALLWYATGLVGHCVVEIVTRAFYALRDTKTPVIIGVAAMALNLAFSLIFSSWFASLGWMPHGGLALANSVATFLEMAGLLIVIHRRLGGLESRSIWLATGQAVLATAGMSAMLQLWLSRMQNQSALINTLGAVALGGVTYVLLVLLLGVPEVRQGLGLLRSLIEKRSQV